MEKNTIEDSFKLVIVGGSAGSLQVLMKILPQLDPIISFALVIVLHRKNTDNSTLEELIALKTSIPVKEVEDKVAVRPGFIYIAPSDYHLLFEKNNVISLDSSEKVNYSRPSIDVSFQSAAEIYKSRTTGIVLSGANGDGTLGLIAIKEVGGTTIVQEPESAEMPYMPRNAIAKALPEQILTVEGIIEYLKIINH